MKSVWAGLAGIYLFLNLHKVEFSLNCKQNTCLAIPATLLLFVSKCWIFPISFNAACLRLAFEILLFSSPANTPENGLAKGKLQGCLYYMFLHSLLTYWKQLKFNPTPEMWSREGWNSATHCLGASQRRWYFCASLFLSQIFPSTFPWYFT